MADPNSCRTCKHRESGDDAYHCYMFKVEPAPLCMQHQDRKPKRVGTIGHVGGRGTLVAALAVILAQAQKDHPGVATRHPRCGYPYCACVGQCFAASQPGAAAGVAASRVLPDPKLCPRCCQYHGPVCPAGVKVEGGNDAR